MNYILAIIITVLTGCATSSPAAPQNVSLAWDASCSVNVTGYRVYYGIKSATPQYTNISSISCGIDAGVVLTNIYFVAYTNFVSVGNVTNAVVTNLVEGTTYEFACTVLDGWGLESEYSNPTWYTVPRSKPSATKLKQPK